MLFIHTISVLALALEATCLTIKLQDEISNIEKRAWSSLGCYTDNVSGRALTNSGAIPGGSSAMTNEACQTACSSTGFSYAGTEYGGECWCGNSIVNGNGPAADGNTGCNMACNGNQAETCGGPNRLTLYQNSGSGTNPTNPSKSGKRGLAYDRNNPFGDATFANLFKSYTFQCSGVSPVPLIQIGVAAVNIAKSILGFNEPDLTYEQSSNMLPAAAATGYKSYIEQFAGQVRIGTPNVLWNNWNSWSSGGSYNSRVWTQYFLGASGSDWFISNVTNAHDTLNLPIWVTEFQCYGTDEQQAQFLRAVLPWLDAQSWVERYAYFGAFPGFLLNTAGTALSLAGQAYVS
ncbi:hypothetical protein EYC84_007262 [Monilinia fructicola]|uniref:WSC domain-containing protein n=1 Tax=Monilinia fructicola TaxID=38448 RepID=A0A5M9K8U3_MONFR|nr:hypothetical protein EYC84_007262 [Monilinia fructicola]